GPFETFKFLPTKKNTTASKNHIKKTAKNPYSNTRNKNPTKIIRATRNEKQKEPPPYTNNSNGGASFWGNPGIKKKKQTKSHTKNRSI
ncbi:hypothetical protein DRJ81_15940, partial [Enterococcus faecalis]